LQIKRGDAAAIDRGALAYGEAKAEYDGIIAGLTVALAQKGTPASLPDIEARLRRGFAKREAFCRSVLALLSGDANAQPLDNEGYRQTYGGQPPRFISRAEQLWI